jgi:hypothetical protein
MNSHFAVFTARQCFRQDVFTRPRLLPDRRSAGDKEAGHSRPLLHPSLVMAGSKPIALDMGDIQSEIVRIELGA